MKNIVVVSQEQLREDTRAAVASPKMSINKLATKTGIDWAVIKRFIRSGSTAGINFGTAEKLSAYLYGDKRPLQNPGNRAA